MKEKQIPFLLNVVCFASKYKFLLIACHLHFFRKQIVWVEIAEECLKKFIIFWNLIILLSFYLGTFSVRLKKLCSMNFCVFKVIDIPIYTILSRESYKIKGFFFLILFISWYLFLKARIKVSPFKYNVKLHKPNIKYVLRMIVQLHTDDHYCNFKHSIFSFFTPSYSEKII